LLRDYFNLSVFQVMGVTDIDDKIINKAQYVSTFHYNIHGYK